MKVQKEKQFILTGSLWKVMWQLSWLAIIAMVLYGLNTVLDGVFVGYYVVAIALAGIYYGCYFSLARFSYTKSVSTITLNY